MVDAAEIAYLTVFLASDKAWAVSGELVVATGGRAVSVLLGATAYFQRESVHGRAYDGF